MNYIDSINLKQGSNYNIIIEILKNSKDKTELVEPLFDKLKNVYKVKYKYPYYYGCFPQTLAGDDDPLDVILITSKKRKRLDIIEVEILGYIKTLDENKIDCKVIVKDINEDIKNINNKVLDIFLFLDKCTKNNNTIIEHKLYSKDEALKLIEQSHVSYLKLNNIIYSV